MAEPYEVTQKCAGVVIEVDAKKRWFTAQVSDLTEPKNPDVLLTISFDKIQEEEQKQLTKGASFIWLFGHNQEQSAAQESFSTLRFQHFPAWTKDEIEANTKAEELAQLFAPN